MQLIYQVREMLQKTFYTLAILRHGVTLRLERKKKSLPVCPVSCLLSFADRITFSVIVFVLAVTGAMLPVHVLTAMQLKLPMFYDNRKMERGGWHLLAVVLGEHITRIQGYTPL